MPSCYGVGEGPAPRRRLLTPRRAPPRAPRGYPRTLVVPPTEGVFGVRVAGTVGMRKLDFLVVAPVEEEGVLGPDEARSSDKAPPTPPSGGEMGLGEEDENCFALASGVEAGEEAFEKSGGEIRVGFFFSSTGGASAVVGVGMGMSMDLLVKTSSFVV